MELMEMKREAIYARQSLDKKDSLSIEGQIKQCQLSTSNEPLIFQDKGYSGKNTERPELQKLISKIESNSISKVVVYKLDRISRNITDFYKLYEIMDKHGCKFVSVSENFDTTTSMGRAMMGILAVFAQMERENIQKRVKDNYYYRTAKTGSWAGGPAPYGFRNAKNEHNISTLIPVEKEIEAVQAIYALYCGYTNLTLGEVAKWLNDNGFKPRKSNTFTSSTISKILQNPIYVVADELLYAYFNTKKINFLNDEESWDGSSSAHVIGKRVGSGNIRSYSSLKDQSIYLTNFKGIIPSVQYINVQKQLELNQQFARSNKTGVLEELSGKLKCNHCKYAIKSYSKSTTGRPYLDCYGNRTLHECHERYNKINFYDLQKAIGKEIQKQLDNINELINRKVTENQKLMDEVDKIKSEIDKLLEISLHSEIAAEAVASKIEEKQTQLHELELRIQMNSTVANYTKISLFINPHINFLTHDSSVIDYELLLTEQKKEVVKILIDRIYLTPDPDKFEIIWNI